MENFFFYICCFLATWSWRCHWLEFLNLKQVTLKVLSQICRDASIVVPRRVHCISLLVQTGNRAVDCNADRYHWECCRVKNMRFKLMLRLQNSLKKYTFVVHNKIWQHFNRCFSSLLLGESSVSWKKTPAAVGWVVMSCPLWGGREWWTFVVCLCSCPCQTCFENTLS